MAKEKGVRLIKWMANIDDWSLYTNKGPIKNMADLAGQKIRFPGGEAFANALKNMGTTPISLPCTEVITPPFGQQLWIASARKRWVLLQKRPGTFWRPRCLHCF